MTTDLHQLDIDLAARTTQADSDRQVVVFRLSAEQYGVDIGTVREIIRRQAVTHVPSAPDSVEGMINLRGQTIPVVDLRRRLNLGLAEDTDSSRIIVLDTGDGDVGVIVDEVMAVLRIPQDAISKVAPIALSDAATYIDGIAELTDSLLMLLDLDQALSAESLRAFRAKEIVIEAVAEPEENDEEAGSKDEPVTEINEPKATVVAEVPEPMIEAPAEINEPEAKATVVAEAPKPVIEAPAEISEPEVAVVAEASEPVIEAVAESEKTDEEAGPDLDIEDEPVVALDEPEVEGDEAPIEVAAALDDEPEAAVEAPEPVIEAPAAVDESDPAPEPGEVTPGLELELEQVSPDPAEAAA